MTTTGWHLGQLTAREKIAKYGYYQEHTPGLWNHHTQLIQLMLVADDFDIKYVYKKDAEHLLNARKDYIVEIDWTGSRLYCGITLNWSYKERYIDISMSGYIKKQLQKHAHTFKKDHLRIVHTQP